LWRIEEARGSSASAGRKTVSRASPLLQAVPSSHGCVGTQFKICAWRARGVAKRKSICGPPTAVELFGQRLHLHLRARGQRFGRRGGFALLPTWSTAVACKDIHLRLPWQNVCVVKLGESHETVFPPAGRFPPSHCPPFLHAPKTTAATRWRSPQRPRSHTGRVMCTEACARSTGAELQPARLPAPPPSASPGRVRCSFRWCARRLERRLGGSAGGPPRKPAPAHAQPAPRPLPPAPTANMAEVSHAPCEAKGGAAAAACTAHLNHVAKETRGSALPAPAPLLLQPSFTTITNPAMAPGAWLLV
jgi:hypothetical protein